MLLAKRVSKLKPSPTLAIDAKAKAMIAQGIDVVNFGVGEPDFDTPDNVKEAAIRAINNGFTKYTAVGGTDELKEAIAKNCRVIIISLIQKIRLLSHAAQSTAFTILRRYYLAKAMRS